MSSPDPHQPVELTSNLSDTASSRSVGVRSRKRARSGDSSTSTGKSAFPGDTGESSSSKITKDSPIHSQALECQTRFSQLDDHIVSYQVQWLKVLALEEQGRYTFWASKTNIFGSETPQIPRTLEYGVVQALSRGLDRLSRLLKEGTIYHHDSKVRDYVVDYLTYELADSIICGEQPNRYINFEPGDSNEIIAQVSESRIAQALLKQTKEVGSGESIYLEPTTELAELFIGIHSSITNLLDLSELSRREQLQIRTEGQMRYNVGFDSSRDVQRIMDRYGFEQSPWLAERLGSLVAQRRQQIRNLATQQAPAHGRVKKAKEDRDTETTSLMTSDPVVGYAWQRIPNLTDLRLHGVQLQYNADVQCPYCQTTQCFQNHLEWNFHIYSDLRLYTCTFENCSASPWRSEDEWFDHELNVHRRQWVCYLCDKKYLLSGEFEDHLLASHRSDVNTAQIPILLEACEKAQLWFDYTSCPFCISWDPGDPGASNLVSFKTHVGSHLRSVALEALPRSIEGLVGLHEEEETTLKGKGKAPVDEGARGLRQPEDDVPTTGKRHGTSREATSWSAGGFAAGFPFWACHNCSGGVFSIATTDKCVFCHHTRCLVCDHF